MNATATDFTSSDHTAVRNLTHNLSQDPEAILELLDQAEKADKLACKAYVKAHKANLRKPTFESGIAQNRLYWAAKNTAWAVEFLRRTFSNTH